MRISDWSSDVCSSDLGTLPAAARRLQGPQGIPDNIRDPVECKREAGSPSPQRPPVGRTGAADQLNPINRKLEDREETMKMLLPAALAATLAVVSPLAAQEKLAITPELVAAAEEEGELTLQYSAPLNAMQALVQSFNEAYPNVTVNLERKAGSSGVQALLQESAAGVHRIDVFQGTDTNANAELIAQGLLAPVVPETADQFPESARVQAPHIYYPDVIRTVVMYNPEFEIGRAHV